MRDIALGSRALIAALPWCSPAAVRARLRLANPVTTELSYFPSNSPFVLSVQTDPNSAAVKGGQQLLAPFPARHVRRDRADVASSTSSGSTTRATSGRCSATRSMIGANGATLSGSQSSNYLIVWVTKDSGQAGRPDEEGLPQRAIHLP